MSVESRRKYYGLAGVLGLGAIGTGIYFAWNEHVLKEDPRAPDLDYEALREMVKKWLEAHPGTGNPGGGLPPTLPDTPEATKVDGAMSHQSFSSSSSGTDSHLFLEVFSSLSVESWIFISAAVVISAMVIAAAHLYPQHQNSAGPKAR